MASRQTVAGHNASFARAGRVQPKEEFSAWEGTLALKATLDVLGLVCMSIGGIGAACFMVAKAPVSPSEKQQAIALRWGKRAPYLGAIFAGGFIARIAAAFS